MMDVKRYPRESLRDEKGMVLVVALLLISVLLLLGTTAVMTSTTDMKISTNYKTGAMAFYAAEAGLEETRARMRANFTPATGATGRIDDSDTTNPAWSVSIGGAGPYTSIQSALVYTVSIVHKTSGGVVLYWGDTNNDGLYERTTTSGAKMRNIYLVTSTGSASGAQKTITAEMTRLPPITAPAALYVEASTTIQGTSTYVIGSDQCGGANLPGIVTTLGVGSIGSNGNPKVCGVTQPYPCSSGTMDVVGNGTYMDIDAIVDEWKKVANYNYTDTGDKTDTGMSWGTPTPGATLQNPSSCSASNIVYYNMNGNTIKLSGGTSGCGLLIVDGDLDLNGGFNWYGMVIVKGSITYTGGGNKNITGAVLSGGSLDADLVGGNANIVYCSSAISNQTLNRSLKILSWKENM